MTTTTLAPNMRVSRWRCDACRRVDIAELALCGLIPPHSGPSRTAALCRTCVEVGRAYAERAGGFLIPGVFYTRGQVEAATREASHAP